MSDSNAMIDGTNKAQGATASVPQNKSLNCSGPEDDRTYNGTLERYAGDGVMVVFNDPQAR